MEIGAFSNEKPQFVVVSKFCHLLRQHVEALLFVTHLGVNVGQLALEPLNAGPGVLNVGL